MKGYFPYFFFNFEKLFFLKKGNIFSSFFLSFVFRFWCKIQEFCVCCAF